MILILGMSNQWHRWVGYLARVTQSYLAKVTQLVSWHQGLAQC